MSRSGIFFLLRHSKLLITRAVCCAVFFAAYLFFSTRVMFVQVNSKSSVTPQEINAVLSECGVVFFAKQENINEWSVIERIMLSHTNLSWSTLNLFPGFAVLELREKVTEDNFPQDGGRLSVSSRDAVVSSINLISGEAVVAVGQPVHEGDLLAYSYPVENPNSWTGIVRGSVRGIYTQVLEFQLPEFITTELYTGRTSQEKWLVILGLRIPLKSADTEFTQYTTSVGYKNVSLFGCELPARVYTRTLAETYAVDTQLNEQNAPLYARRICLEWEKQLEDGVRVLSERIDLQQTDGVMWVYAEYRLEGEIAVFVDP